MEAIQQKVELSQQLEEWKTDMEQLLEEQIRERLVVSEAGRGGGGRKSLAPAAAGHYQQQQQQPSSTPISSRFLSFFQRSSN